MSSTMMENRMKIIIKRKECFEISFKYYYNKNKKFSHTLEYPKSIIPLDDSLFRIALLSRPDNSERYEIEGLKVHESVKNHFENQLGSLINVPLDEELLAKKQKIVSLPKHTLLCFSGGFDSVAAMALLDNSTGLLSIDFGGWFEREALFFKKFKTTTVKWKLRGSRSNQSVKFNESIDWRFLLAPALLFRKEHEHLAILTGTIMEAAPYWFNGIERPKFKEYNKDYGSSVALVNPIACLTEYATTLIISKYLSSEDIQLSLKSLASPNSIKAFRKKTLLSLVEGTTLPKPHKKMSKHRYGTSFADDFLAIYFCWKCGRDWVLNNYVDQLPSVTYNIDMSFVEKANQINLDALNEGLRSDVVNKLKEYNIEMYTENDFLELEKVKAIILSKTGVRKGIKLIKYRLKVLLKSSLSK